MSSKNKNKRCVVRRIRRRLNEGLDHFKFVRNGINKIMYGCGFTRLRDNSIRE